MTTYTHSLQVKALDAMLAAVDLPLDGREWALTLNVLADLLNGLAEEPPDLAEQIVDAVEKFTGLGLEEAPYAGAVAAVRQVLTKARGPAWPTFAPDAFLEAEYEDRFVEAD